MSKHTTLAAFRHTNPSTIEATIYLLDFLWLAFQIKSATNEAEIGEVISEDDAEDFCRRQNVSIYKLLREE